MQTKRYNIDPVNHPLPQVQINIDPAMPYHPCATPFLNGSINKPTPYLLALLSTWSIWFAIQLRFMREILLGW